MEKKTKKLTYDEFYEMCKGLSYNMSSKAEELSRQHDERLLTLIGFLIATSGIIITACDASGLVRRCLGLSIVCFVLGLLYNLNIIQSQSINVCLSLKNVYGIPSLKTKKERLKAFEEIEKGIEPNKVLIFFKKLSSFLQSIGIILFIIGLFIYL